MVMCPLMASSMRLLKLRLFRAMDALAHYKLGRRRREEKKNNVSKTEGKRRQKMPRFQHSQFIPPALQR